MRKRELKGDGVKKSENFDDIISGSPLMLQFVVKFPSSPRPPMRVRPYAPTSETPLGPLGAAPRYIRAGRKTVVKLRSKKEINEEWRGEFPLLLLRSQSHHSLVDFENCKPSAEEEGASRYDVRKIFRFFDPLLPCG